MEKKLKLIAVTGPTATGKTSLAVRLARFFDGEIISLDSRQLYRTMDIGSGKDLSEYGEIPYHLIDIAHPSQTVDLAQVGKQCNSSVIGALYHRSCSCQISACERASTSVFDTSWFAHFHTDVGIVTLAAPMPSTMVPR
jgi:cytidylate kinase